MARLFLGVDGGNTKTIALVARRDGTIVGSGRSLGTADIHATSPQRALTVVEQAVAAALDSLPGRQRSTGLAGSAFGMAGADWPEDVELLTAMLGERWPEPLVVNDAIGALRAAIPEGWGVVVVCGTGTATGARGPHGRTWHSSFWQEPQGARELGEKAFRAILRADLGIDPPTTLTPRVLAALDAPDVETILHRHTRRGPEQWDEPAVLASVLLDAAEDGDRTAVTIVRDHGTALGTYALATARRVRAVDGPFGVALTGGVFRHPGRVLRDAAIAAVIAGAPLARELTPSLEPVAGALLLALDRAGIAVTSAVEARLRATLPDSGLYETRPATMAAIE